jgi:hypothetical protein
MIEAPISGRSQLSIIMPLVQPSSIPGVSLLHPYTQHGFADCYTTTVVGSVSHQEFVQAFYTSWVFKLERSILKWTVSKPSTDADAARLSAAESDSFAAWRVEARTHNQLLMSDVLGNTRSWLMTAPEDANTRLYFGSAVVAHENRKTGVRSLGWIFRALLGFHRVYSRVLLHAARSRLDARAQR